MTYSMFACKPFFIGLVLTPIHIPSRHCLHPTSHSPVCPHRKAHPVAAAHFQAEALSRITTVARVALNNDVAGLWLGVRLQMIGVLITVVIALGAVMCVAAPNACPVAPNANLLGLSILYSISIVGNLNGLVGAVTGALK